jgi:1-aminocyclopropane-1-carboxylate deaminase/D-cysteine desulfhydrase-like pyridoxal-dependent ACC family enzyme
MAEAEAGKSQLAQEIINWHTDNMPLTVVLPSGTGTTSLYLQKYLYQQQTNIQVVTCAVVGDSSYLSLQWQQLEHDFNYYPKIISLAKKYHFGNLYVDAYNIWNELCESGIEFDLLYDPYGWMVVVELLKQGHNNILYIHQGGIHGNLSMHPRYQRKFS